MTLLQGVAIADYAIGQLPGEGAPVLPPVPTRFRYATHSFVTSATDTPAHTPVHGRLLSSFTVRRAIVSGVEGRLGSSLQLSVDNEVELANHDRTLDFLLSGDADGRDVTIKIGTLVEGEDEIDYAGFQTTAVVTAGTFSADVGVLRLRLSDPGLLLQDPLQTRSYLGTGGREGTIDLTGRSKPYAIGKCDNVPAQVLDPAILTYQVATRPLTSAFRVYDAGVRLTVTNTVANYAALVSVDVNPGKAAVCPSEARFKLGSPPFGRVTADIRTVPTGTFHHTAALIDTILAEAKVSAAKRNIQTVSAAAEDEVGFFLPAGQNVTVEQAVTALAGAAGAVFGPDRSGVYRLIWLSGSALANSPAFVFDDRTLRDVQRLPLPYGVPWRSWLIGKNKNWQVQDAGELAIVVTSERRQFLEQEFSTVSTEDPDIIYRHLTSRQTALVPTFYAYPSTSPASTTVPALRFAERMTTWYALNRAMYRIVVKTAVGQVEIGDIVSISSAYLGLSGGFSGMVISIADSLATSETELILFG